MAKVITPITSSLLFNLFTSNDYEFTYYESLSIRMDLSSLIEQ